MLVVEKRGEREREKYIHSFWSHFRHTRVPTYILLLLLCIPLQVRVVLGDWCSSAHEGGTNAYDNTHKLASFTKREYLILFLSDECIAQISQIIHLFFDWIRKKIDLRE